MFNLLRGVYLRYLAKKKPFIYARTMGVSVGAGTRFMSCKHGMFSTEPYLISIGKNCLITGEVQFITHDGSVYHLKKKHPKADLFGSIKIGDNVFIGFRSIVLPGVEIGSNVIIGAGSVVSKSIPPNSVAAGVPAKVISNIDDYLTKIEKRIIHTGGMPFAEKKKIVLASLK